jgi:hypothetical protein
LPALLIVALTLDSPKAATAFAPQVAAAIAERIPGALPPAARWNPSWGTVAGVEVFDRLRLEDEDPESALPWRRFVAGGAVLPAHDEEALAAARIQGLAPHRLSLAANALRDAFLDGDDRRIALALAGLAVTAADLADPFLVTPAEVDEVTHARARFSDLLVDADTQGLAGSVAIAAEPVQAALELAAQSAAVRGAVEAAVQSGDTEALAALRRGRLDAALATARSIALWAWQAANAPTVPYAGAPAGSIRIAPNPVERHSTLSFVLPRPGAATLTVFDATGRKVWTQALGPRAAGEQGAMFVRGAFDALAPGVYLVAVTTGDFRATGRLVHVR